MKYRKLFVFFLFVIIIISTSCKQSQTASKQINFSGAYALYPLNLKWSEEYKKLNPDLIFNVQSGGADKGLTDALTGNADVGMFSREISDNELSKGVWYIAVAKDAVFPTISSKNPYINTLKARGLTKQQFEKIFVNGAKISWEDVLGLKNGKSTRVDVYARSDASGAAESLAAFFNTHQENLKGIAMLGDPGIAHAVKKDANGIGFNNTQYIFDMQSGNKIDGIEILPFDVNGNGQIDSAENFYTNLNSVTSSVLDGNYPSPPVRDLYFVCKQKPTNQKIIDYFKWILTDGQKFVQAAGYVPLPDNVLKEQLQKLE